MAYQLFNGTSVKGWQELGTVPGNFNLVYFRLFGVDFTIPDYKGELIISRLTGSQLDYRYVVTARSVWGNAIAIEDLQPLRYQPEDRWSIGMQWRLPGIDWELYSEG